MRRPLSVEAAVGWHDDKDNPSGARQSYDWDGMRYHRTERRGGKVIAEYFYDDEKGEPYLRVERTEDKQFPQSHWVPGDHFTRRGRWAPGKPKGPKIPYMLSNLIALAPDVPVFITEGEKDCESVFELELDATCASEGAGKWTPDLNRWFEGRKRVVILADNDRAGRQHAQKVARNLAKVVEQVRIVEFTRLPDGSSMPEGGDVSDWIAAGGTKEQLLELVEAAAVYVGLPQIQIIIGQHARAQDETEAALIRANQPVLVRAGVLVQPLWTEYPNSKGGKTTVTVLRPLTVSNLAYMLSKHAATFAKYDARKKGLSPIDPPTAILNGLLERGHWLFPRVSGVINAPTLRPDGTILDQPGYDPATQLWCWPDSNLVMPAVPDRPTKADAAEALQKLSTLLDEFPFVTPLDRSVALAAILTAILRGAFDVAPMYLFLAHAAGTGKSFLVNLISTMVHGRPCPVITASDDKHEMEKRLGALLLEGAPIVSLDNLSENLGGDLLCQITEQPLVKVRILGKSETPECEWRGTLFATGNNVSYEGDMTRRGLISNLDAGVERPETRAFKFDPIAWVMANRGEYIACAIVIARAYLTSGDPVGCTPLGSYGGWSKFVREPLIWLEQPDPVDSMEQARADDPERNFAVALFDRWRSHLKVGEAYSVAQIIECARETRPSGSMGVGSADYEHVRPDFYSLLSEKCPLFKGGIDPKQLGKRLSRLKGQVHGGHRLVVAKESKSHGNRWALVNVEAAKSGTGG